MSRASHRVIDQSDAKKNLRSCMESACVEVQCGVKAYTEVTKDRFVLAKAHPKSAPNTYYVFPASEKSMYSVCVEVLAEFDAMMLPWGQNEVHTIELDGEVDIMLTPKLSGCTLVADMGRRRPRVSHINFVDGDGVFDSASARKALLLEYGAGVVFDKERFFVLERANYALGEESKTESGRCASVVLMHEDDCWHVVAQQANNGELVQTMAQQQSVIHPFRAGLYSGAAPTEGGTIGGPGGRLVAEEGKDAADETMDDEEQMDERSRPGGS